MSAHSCRLIAKAHCFSLYYTWLRNCLHITDACISRVHACIAFELRRAVSESPCGGSDNDFALMVSVMQILTLRINWIYSPDVYNSPHALIILYHMQCYYFLTWSAITSPHALLLITCTAINSSHILLLLHHRKWHYLTTCTALTSSYARLWRHRIHCY